MQSALWRSARDVRSLLLKDRVTPVSFRALLEAVPSRDRDTWLDLLWDLDELSADDPDLPRGCVPYLPCEISNILDAVQQTAVTHDDVLVDVGSGTGRVALLAHLLTGAGCIGLEIQPSLVRAATARADWLRLERVRFISGDAVDLVRFFMTGTVFFLYCPFGGDRLRRFLDSLEEVACTRRIRVCCIDMPPLERPWLVRVPSLSSRIDVYCSAPVR